MSNTPNFSEEQKKILKNLKETIEKAQDKVFNFLLVGKTGTGKSSTINSLLGKEVAPTNEFEPETLDIEEYESDINGFKFNVIDTPGLCDDLPEYNNDYEYLELMRKKVTKVDSMWFVARLDETRVSSDEKRGIKLISKAFTKDIWKNAIIIFTHSDKKDTNTYQSFLEKRTELIKKEIEKFTGDKELSSKIPVVAVSNIQETTPDGKNWLAELYIKIIQTISKNSFNTFFFATIDAITPPVEKSQGQSRRVPRIQLNDTQEKILRQEVSNGITEIDELVIASLPVGAVLGGVIGTLVGGPVGTWVGAWGGATIGITVAETIRGVGKFIASFWKKK